MLGMLKRHEVEILLKAGHAQTEVARLAGVSLCSVKRIAEEAPVVHVDDAAEREKRRIGRPSKVDDFRKFIVALLEEKPGLPSLEILRRIREAGYPGGKTALYALVARPIYFVELRNGYVCSWCQVDQGQLIVIPHPHSHQDVR